MQIRIKIFNKLINLYLILDLINNNLLSWDRKCKLPAFKKLIKLYKTLDVVNNYMLSWDSKFNLPDFKKKNIL